MKSRHEARKVIISQITRSIFSLLRPRGSCLSFLSLQSTIYMDFLEAAREKKNGSNHLNLEISLSLQRKPNMLEPHCIKRKEIPTQFMKPKRQSTSKCQEWRRKTPTENHQNGKIWKKGLWFHSVNICMWYGYSKAMKYSYSWVLLTWRPQLFMLYASWPSKICCLRAGVGGARA